MRLPMNNDLNKEEKILKSKLNVELEDYNSELSLQKVLSKAKGETALKDFFGLFFSWLWILFILCGATAYKFKVDHRLNRRSLNSRKSSSK